MRVQSKIEWQQTTSLLRHTSTSWLTMWRNSRHENNVMATRHWTVFCHIVIIYQRLSLIVTANRCQSTTKNSIKNCTYGPYEWWPQTSGAAYDSWFPEWGLWQYNWNIKAARLVVPYMAVSEFCQHVTFLRNDVIKFWSFLGFGVMCWRFTSIKCCANRQCCLFTVGSDVSKRFWKNKIVFKTMTSSTCPISDKNCQGSRSFFNGKLLTRSLKNKNKICF